jgi:uncharacterized repeat protein (TIGR03803 family)
MRDAYKPFSAYPFVTYKLAFTFDKHDGADPTAGLTALNGTLYGTTYGGGLESHGCARYGGCGTVFSLTAAGKERVLYRFRGYPTDGEFPNGLTVLNGTLYGTTLNGGPSDEGTVFSITTAGKERVIYSFKNGNGDAEVPADSLTVLHGTLYGTTEYYGGSGRPHCSNVSSGGCGTVFSVTTAGIERVLYRFKAKHDGGWPFAGLTVLNGVLYGTTMIGGNVEGPEGDGVVFSITSGGRYHVLHTFQGGNDGQNPYAGLTLFNGRLYGATKGGGANNDGTVYSVTTAGQENVLYSFKGCRRYGDGSDPLAAPTELNGTLYGTTFGGGTCRRYARIV